MSTAAAATAPAWRPRSGSAHRLAFVDTRGDIELTDTDTGVREWRVPASPAPRQLLWSPAGTRLLSVAADRLSLYDALGRRLATAAVPAGDTVRAAAFAHAGTRVAVVLEGRGRAGDTVAVLDATPRGLARPAAPLLRVGRPIRGISWSPADRWLVTSDPTADQWLFVATAPPSRLLALSRVAGQFRAGGPAPARFPAVAGWQAYPSGTR